MDLAADVRVIRAPSLKRGKSEGGLNERVSLAKLFLKNRKKSKNIREILFRFSSVGSKKLQCFKINSIPLGT